MTSTVGDSDVLAISCVGLFNGKLVDDDDDDVDDKAVRSVALSAAIEEFSEIAEVDALEPLKASEALELSRKVQRNPPSSF
jgi:hypothetical protein